MGIDKEYIAQTLKNTPANLRKSEVERLANFYGVATQTIWRKANEAGYRVRSERRDKGVTALDNGTLDIIAARVHLSKRLTKGHTCSVKKAVKDLTKATEIPVSYPHVCKVLRENGLDRESLLRRDPHTQLISLHPNHVHQFDVTNCLQWHFKNKGALTERDVERMFYSNKIVKEAQKIKLELLRFVIVDHCSGAFFFKYYYTTGERPEDGADFFYNAWANKTPLIQENLGIADYSGSYRFNGVPKMLVSDKGSILRSKVMQNLMDGLDVKVELHQAGNPRAKGMVEGLMKIIGEGFESDLKIYNIQSLADLNRFALDWCITKNAENGFRNTQTCRSRLWLKIKHEELRLCPAEVIFKKLQHKPTEERRCDGAGIISYEGKHYKCPDVNATNNRVIVKMNAYEYPKIDIHFNGFVYCAAPLETDEYGRKILPDAAIFGQYKAPKQTKTQLAKTRLEKVAQEQWAVGHVGNKDKRQAVPPITNALPTQTTAPDNLVFITPHGTQIQTPDTHKPLTQQVIINIDKPFNPIQKMRLIPVSEIIRLYVAEFGKLSVAQNQKLKTKYSSGVPEHITLNDVYNYLNPKEALNAAQNY